MAWTQAFVGVGAVEDRAERALRWPIGAASPLWVLFGAAASAGVAWWWLTRWSQAVNVEALAGLAAGQTTQAVETAADSEAATVAADAAARAEPAAEPPAAARVPAAEVATAAVKTPEPAEPAAADDLTRMAGIGPKLSAALAARGVTRFAQIAAWSADDLAELDAALSLKGRAVREAWVAQAKRLATGAPD